MGQARPPPLDLHVRSEMRELVRSNDVVFLSWVVATMRSEGIEAVVFDTHTSLVEGSIGAIQRRVMVADSDYEEARRVLDERSEARAVGKECVRRCRFRWGTNT